jgi:3-phenylpropionate/trans-cinnamate dioxygenase ferredoxin subunit
LSSHRVAGVTDLEPETATQVVVDGEEICLARAEDGTFHALVDVCSHEEFPLSDGEVWGTEIECARHGSRFNLETGLPRGLPATGPVRAFAVKVEGDDVYVEK